MEKKDQIFDAINKGLRPSSKSLRPSSYYYDGIVSGNRYVLSEAITLIESSNTDKRKLAAEVSNLCLHEAKKRQTLRIAITGSPGVGKSTFINSFGKYMIAHGKKIAVLAIDPSSRLSHGSILGDKTRMEDLVGHDQAYIRPSAAGTLLGGVALGTKASIPLLEAAGFDTILLETVGVGQSEYMAADMCDMTILLIQPGSGDDVQGIKRGIVEIADLIAITKSDGDQKELASRSQKYYQEALHYNGRRKDDHHVAVVAISSLTNLGFDELYRKTEDFHQLLLSSGQFYQKRIDQEIKWFEASIKESAFRLLMQKNELSESFNTLVKQITSSGISTHAAIEAFEEILHL